MGQPGTPLGIARACGHCLEGGWSQQDSSKSEKREEAWELWDLDLEFRAKGIFMISDRPSEDLAVLGETWA